MKILLYFFQFFLYYKPVAYSTINLFLPPSNLRRSERYYYVCKRLNFQLKRIHYWMRKGLYRLTVLCSEITHIIVSTNMYSCTSLVCFSPRRVADARVNLYLFARSPVLAKSARNRWRSVFNGPQRR